MQNKVSDLKRRKVPFTTVHQENLRLPFATEIPSRSLKHIHTGIKQLRTDLPRVVDCRRVTRIHSDKEETVELAS